MTDSSTISADQPLFDAASNGDVAALAAILDQHPEKLLVRNQPYEHTLLHLAAFAGRLPVVDLLLARGLDVNSREKGDNTYAMHWAAAAGHLDVVRRLADAGGDVVGRGDDHELEVIGWATCWEGIDQRHREIADFLVSRGARHHIYSAMAVGKPDEVRKLVAADPSVLEQPMSRNEGHQRPIHFAVRMNLPDMVDLLLELGADFRGTDDSGNTASLLANAPQADRRLLEWQLKHGEPLDLFTAVALGDWKSAEPLLSAMQASSDIGSLDAGVLHLMAKRNDIVAVKWLLAHGVDPSARWSHWGNELTAMHLAAWQNHADVVRLLLESGADPTIHDTEHDSDVLGWARYGQRSEIVGILEEYDRAAEEKIPTE